MIETIIKELKNQIFNIVQNIYSSNLNASNFTEEDVFFEVPASKDHGDYSTNVAFKLARIARKAPNLIATDIVSQIDTDKAHVKKVEVGGGFINFFIDNNYLANVVFLINKEGENYSKSNIGNKEKVNIEYVSANPTGFLHIGHCRGAAYGDSLARILKKTGYDVTREYYVNDAGNQINNLAKSIYARYRELYNLDFDLDDDCYKGPEIIVIAKEIEEKYQDKYLKEEWFDDFRNIGTEKLLNTLKKDLKDFNVEFDVWSSERSLYANGSVEKTIDYLISHDYTYEKDGALWLKTTLYGDEKDRVIKKSDGSLTYLTPDIAYHADKLSRGYDQLIDVLGADHHGYIPRLKAAIAFVGGNPDKLDVEILQMVRVMQNNVEIKMSKRSGRAITMRDLIDEVGSDVLRYLFIEKALSSQMDLDLDLALKEGSENPVYYAQYAYARIASLFRTYPEFKQVNEFKKLDISSIKDLIDCLIAYRNVVEEVALKRIPHRLCQYISDLAKALHSYYNNEKIISDDALLTNEKLTVLRSVQIILKDALGLIGVNTKERM